MTDSERFTLSALLYLIFNRHESVNYPYTTFSASAIAISYSVIVSIFALTRGMLRVILRESFVFKSVWVLETIGDRLGTRSTSSKVNPSLIFNIL